MPSSCTLFSLSPADLATTTSSSATGARHNGRPLYAGLLQPHSVPPRLAIFRRRWDRLEARLTSSATAANQTAVDSVVGFFSDRWAESPARTTADPQLDLDDGQSDNWADSRIPAVFVVAGVGVGAHRLFFRNLTAAVASPAVVVTISAADGSSVKSVLAALVRRVLAALQAAGVDSGPDEDDDAGTRLPYDLAAIPAHVPVLVAVEEADGFDAGLVADLIDSLASWSGRIQLGFVFAVATAADAFVDRLPPSATAMLDGKVVRLGRAAVLDRFVVATTTASERDGDDDPADHPAQLGPATLSALTQWQTTSGPSDQLVMDALKHSLLSHFAANPLSELLAAPTSLPSRPEPALIAAIRSTPSFRAAVETAVGSNKPADILIGRYLLSSDDYLVAFVRAHLARSLARYDRVGLAARLFVSLYSALFPTRAGRSIATTMAAGLAGSFASSAPVRETLLMLRQSRSDTALSAVTAGLAVLNSSTNSFSTRSTVPVPLPSQSFSLASTSALPFPLPPLPTLPIVDTVEPDVDIAPFTAVVSAMTALIDFVSSQTSPSSPRSDPKLLRSDVDTASNHVRATVVAQKVSLSRHHASLTPDEKIYSSLLATITDRLTDLFTSTFLSSESSRSEFNPSDRSKQSYSIVQCLPFSESFLFDCPSIFRSAFVPKSRESIHRALSRPCDYLSCKCCSSSNLSVHTPDTALLYRLSLDSAGGLINVSDLLTAFEAVKSKSPTSIIAFQAAFAELVFIGLFKKTGKKQDHVARAVWANI